MSDTYTGGICFGLWEPLVFLAPIYQPRPRQ